LADKWNCASGLVKAQLASVAHVLAISFSNDSEARVLAESYGAAALLDKMKLYSELLPAINNCLGQINKHMGERLKRKATAA
jgi:hypothetical protein